jgi:hypothetical protein
LHTGALDVFFQGDPFALEPILVVKPTRSENAAEPRPELQVLWQQSCRGHAPPDHRLQRSIPGGARPYLALVELMIAQPQWSSCWAESMDQPILNMLVWSGAIAAAGISY